MADNIEKIIDWQKSRDPKLFSELVIQYQPVINSVVNKYRSVGVSPATLRAQATTQLIKAFKSYDPNRGTQPTTHVWNQMQKVQRVATESLTSGHMPEYRNIKRSTFVTVRDNLQDRLGYEPSTQDMAEELKWSQNEVARMNAELGGEVTASKAEFDFYGTSTQSESRDRLLMDYLYHDLTGRDKTIFEYSLGVGGRPRLSNKQIAQKLNTNEMAIHRAKKSMAEKLKRYR